MSLLYPLRKEIKKVPPSLRVPVVSLLNIGHVPALSSFFEKSREKLGIAGRPPTAYSLKEALSEFQAIARRSGLSPVVAPVRRAHRRGVRG
ncbi:TPA: hypothetical protein EYP44_03635 [Candidatus Bathyarchaeota archaeon]|nr:hypothetical protein [Candidatus Bathyarchaeota archaeon]